MTDTELPGLPELPLRTATAADWPAVSALLSTAFLRPPHDEERDAVSRNLFEPERSLLAEDGGAMVAHASAYTRDLAVPGGVLAAAHVSLVVVAPTHRRRGLLTRMMHRQLAEAPEPVAVLWASEGRIYPRFGYGMATQRVSLAADSRELPVPAPAGPGRLRDLPAGAAPTVLPEVYDAVWRDRPGWSGRDERWWRRLLSDPPADRDGATAHRITVHEGAAGVDGYAIWRAKGDWSAQGPNGVVDVEEVVTADPDAYRRLWRFLLTVDLTRSVKLWLGGLDEPLLHLTTEPRRLGAALGDGLWIRLLDLPAALAARRYAAPVDVVLEVTDALRPGNAGRWRLTGDPGRASCVPTSDPPDLVCDTSALAAAYLGGIPLSVLAAGGRVREARPGALAAAGVGFGWHRPPTGIEIF